MIKLEHWTDRKWRPMMGWMYMAVCILDFAIFPVLWSALQAHYSGQVTNQWDPLTLKGAGLFHMAMGAVLGVTAWKRSEEKLAGIQNELSPSIPTTSQSSRFGTSDTALYQKGFNQSASSGVTTSSTGSSPSQDSTKQIVPQGPMPQL